MTNKLKNEKVLIENEDIDDDFELPIDIPNTKIDRPPKKI